MDKSNRLDAKARRTLIQQCLAEQHRLRNDGFSVRLPILRDLRDAELVAAHADLFRKGKEARAAKAKADLDARYEAKRGIRPVRRSEPARDRDPVVERIREVRRESQEQVREALEALSGLSLACVPAEAAE